MIYTSYFSKCDQLKENGIVPIAITFMLPYGYNGLWYKELAPSWSILSEYKDKSDNDRYIQRYENEILKDKNIERVFLDLYNLAGETLNFALICYEKSDEFCHRQLVADWFTKHGYTCKEWKNNDEF